MGPVPDPLCVFGRIDGHLRQRPFLRLGARPRRLVATPALHPEQTFSVSVFRHGAQGPASGVDLISAPDPSRT
jgi:hypothetical protein